MNWGKSIVAAFLFFATFIFVLVYICVKQDMPLVSKDYYKDELNYQQQIQRLNNAEQLASKPSFQKSGSDLNVVFNKLSLVENGELRLFRPSDGRLDVKFKIESQVDSVLRLDVASLPAGMYRAKMFWKMYGKEFYVEDIINL
jgi:hypothetical protein